MGLFSSLFGSQTSTTAAPFMSRAWTPQLQPLREGINRAKRSLRNTDLSDDFVGDNNYWKTGRRIDESRDLISGQGRSLAELLGSTAAGGAGLVNAFGQTAGQIAGANNPYFTAGADAAAGTFDGYGAAADRAGTMFDSVSGNPTDRIIADAQKYVDNGVVQGQIDSAIGDVERGFRETRGGINGAASGTGNMNSTRAGVLESRALDDAMDRAGDISAGIRSAALDRGMAMSQGQYNTSVNQQMTANDQMTGILDRINAAYGNALSGQVSAGQLMGQAGQMGVSTGVTGYDVLKDTGTTALGFDQAANQLGIGKQMSNFDVLNRYFDAIGRDWGRNGFQSQVSEEGSIFGQVLGGASSVLGGFGALK